MVLKVYIKIFLIALFYAIEFLIIFILAEKLFAKVLQSLKTCVLVNNNVYGKLVASLESAEIFDESFKVTLVPFCLFQTLIYEVAMRQYKVTFYVTSYV